MHGPYVSYNGIYVVGILELFLQRFQSYSVVRTESPTGTDKMLVIIMMYMGNGEKQDIDLFKYVLADYTFQIGHDKAFFHVQVSS